MQPGDYMKISTGEFIIKSPNGIVASIRNHKIIEHDDGTITASPSILLTGYTYPDRPGEVNWHGFLEKGVWREV